MSGEAKAKWMRDYRKTERGAVNVKVSSRANALALKWIRVEHPDIWGGFLEQAWNELTDDLPRIGRPRGGAA